MSEKVRFKRYLHSSKESNFDLVDFFGDDGLKFCGYEEELIYEYDKSTKELKLIGADGFYLGEEKVHDSELVKIQEMKSE